MVKKCLYCGCELDDESVVDFCHRCGIGVFGHQMFNAIKQNMEKAREKGDLCHMNNTCELSIKNPEQNGF